jgi:hypothetical protein
MRLYRWVTGIGCLLAVGILAADQVAGSPLPGSVAVVRIGAGSVMVALAAWWWRERRK